MNESRPAAIQGSLIHRLANEERAIVTFAGQGLDYVGTLSELRSAFPGSRRIIGAALQQLDAMASDPRLEATGRWRNIERFERVFESDDAAAWMPSAVSYPLIFLTQALTWEATRRAGLSEAISKGNILGFTGHSQGMLAACFAATLADKPWDDDLFSKYLRLAAWQGIWVEVAFVEATGAPPGPEGTTPMLSINGLRPEELDALLDGFEKQRGVRLHVPLRNGRERHVVGGTAPMVAAFQEFVEAHLAKRLDAKKKGLGPGRAPKATFEYLPLSAAFHTPCMAAVEPDLVRVWTEDGLTIDPSSFCAPVHRCVDGTVYGQRGTALEDFAQTQCSDPVDWVGTLDAMSEAYEFDWVIDGGPALGLSGLSKSVLRGRGVQVVEIGTAEKRELLTSAAAPTRPLPWSAFLPRVETDASGEERIVNRFTEAAKRPPMILPGMTPTTVDAGIVAAAANAGYMAELAGGGQVNRPVFEERVKELGELLEPGAEVVFNALYLDRYLWDLHVAGEGLLLQFRRRGAPFCGITISAGLPEPEEAKQLLDTFRDAGLWLNAFKPGTVAQAKQVVAIAKEAADHTIFVHLEGGKAGGHHSWEDLDDLLLGAYGMLRAQPNIVLCVGGGVRDEARAAELLTGQWSRKYNRLAMPVDAILLGTVTMAVKEATATKAVKAALANAPGTDSWVSPGRVEGAVTSGKSQLDADIHYLDNAASRCGRLLDAVAGDAEKVAARRDEIIAALNQTAKPYLGDICEMSWLALLERLVSLMAIGEHGRYEDGVWLDPSWRARVWDVLGRAVARAEGATSERRESANTSPSCLDEPTSAIEELRSVWPELNELSPTPSDEQWFLSDVCRRPGKPVCFVPVIDEDVRRWYKSDSLWQAQHGAYAAEQVLVIPGPEAVTGIETADEPVADVLARYTVAARDAARACDATARPVQWPDGVDVRDGDAWRLRFSDGVDPRWRGAALAAFPSETTEVLGAPAWFDGNRPVSNPLHTMIAGLAGDVLHATDTGWRYEPDSADGEFVEAALTGEGVVVTVHMGADTPERVFELRPVLRGGDRAWVLDSKKESATQAAFLAASMGGASPMAPTALFETATLPVRVDREAGRLYARATGLRTQSVPDGLLFSIAWPAVFSVLSAPDIMEGFEKLVHAHNKVERGALEWGASLQLDVRVERVADSSAGREIDAIAVFRDGERVAATMRSRFFIRGDFGGTQFRERRHERWDDDVTLPDAAAVRFLDGIGGVTLSSHEPGDVRVVAEGRFVLSRSGTAHATASGRVERDGASVGQIEIDTQAAHAMHPLRAALQTLGVHAREEHARPVKSLASGTDRAPSRMDAFARAGGDFNPIHRNLLYARYAGFERPIVHGMWTAARLDAFVRDEVLSGNVDGLSECQTEFLSPLLPGESIAMSCERVGLCDAGVILEATASAVRGENQVAVARTRSVVATPKTAWVFPGQGIQRQGMGLDAMQRSAAARNVWTRADAYTRERHGFSILNIVRDNPTSLDVRGVQMKHPAGVLHLTQFTQVGMAVLAQAQVAELREAGLSFDGDITCGHSVGEYNALAALAQVITLEAGIDAVYRRGLAMHQLVPRNHRGESGYAMSVVRPHYAGLNHAGAEELVARIQETTGEFIEIVNFNVKGRQYSVTGTTAALQHMHDALDELSSSNGKPAWIQVPGIDVPFHSRALRAGVTAFRDALQDTLALELDVSPLIGRYIPNLVPRLFSLSREYVTEVAEYSGSPILNEVLAAWTSAPPADLGRTLLIELLAYQFASPVRWIETQDMLFGQLGVERIVEVGLGSQPTLANMARYTQRLLGGTGDHVQVLNAEADDAIVRYADAGTKAAEKTSDHTAKAADATPVAPAPEAAAPVAAAPAAAPTAAVGKPAEREGTVLDSLRVLLANQAKVAVSQVSDTETIEDLFDGVSARRNQALMDIGAEFAVGSVDGAHEKPLTALATAIEARGGTGASAGKYLRATQDAAVQRFGARANLGRSAIEDLLAQRYGLDAGWSNLVLSRLALEIRPGNSARGGELGAHPDAVPADKNAATEVLDDVVAATGRSFGATLGPLSAGGPGAGGAAVDAAVVRELEEKVLGPDGTLAGWARDLLGRIDPTAVETPTQPDAAHAIAARILAEFGEDFVDWISPKFEHKKHVVFSHAWSHAQRDVIALYADASNGRGTPAQRQREALRLAGHAANPRVAGAARWAAARATALGHTEAATLLTQVAGGGTMPPLDWEPSQPLLHWEADGVRYEEVARDQTRAGQINSWFDDAGISIVGHPDVTAAWKQASASGVDAPLSLAGETALVTGASPGGIAFEMAAQLLRGGARVVVTTTTYNKRRLEQYRRLYQAAAAPGAELHVVPFNQASAADVEGFLDWVFSRVTVQEGASTRELKPAFRPSLIVPFGAMSDLATLDGVDGKSEAALRAMLVGVERLITGVGARYRRDGLPGTPCHVLLPLSPNHGTFGGDGFYGEAKAALEAMLNKVKSEQDTWGAAISVCGARIGWVRGTGLMDANNPLAAMLEDEFGMTTFSAGEMAHLLVALCAPAIRSAMAESPAIAELSAGLEGLPSLRGTIDGLRGRIEGHVRAASRGRELQTRYEGLLAVAEQSAPSQALPPWAVSYDRGHRPWGRPSPDLHDAIVIVGVGEVSPWGSMRTRWEAEANRKLSAAGVLELAWMTGRVAFVEDGNGGRWVDQESGDTVDEHEIAERYHDAVWETSGIRVIDTDVAGFDPDHVEVLAQVYLDKDFTFPVGSEEEAASFLRADPQHTNIHFDDATSQWRVTRLSGSVMRVPRAKKWRRHVAALVPSGFDPQRYGVTAEMAASVDRVTLFALIATVDAFLSAGLTPEELLSKLHPARVGNTQGSGIGGMESLRRLYQDELLDTERQSDVIQESLINVVAGYVVQSYVGSYGTMSHPVAACATAAVSLESAYDKIRVGKSDFVVAGGFDDIGGAGVRGFADMNATADTRDMIDQGLEPSAMSRPNDVRRGGFLEAQGGGTFLVTRGSIARDLGLPVKAVVAYAGTFGDGVQLSIPAPGPGALAAAMGGQGSPIANEMRRWGVSADDIRIAYKHDTSTRANDPNENKLHQSLQRALGRSEGAPLMVVSQKALTGHSKGGAAAFQIIGACQAMASGLVPGNPNLDTVDPTIAEHEHLVLSDRTVDFGDADRIDAVMVTSLGFGHVSAVVLLVHPDAFVSALGDDERSTWESEVQRRARRSATEWQQILAGRSDAFERRTDGRFATSRDDEESKMLLDPDARLAVETATYTHEP